MVCLATIGSGYFNMGYVNVHTCGGMATIASKPTFQERCNGDAHRSTATKA
jgi:hypothetical protein